MVDLCGSSCECMPLFLDIPQFGESVGHSCAPHPSGLAACALLLPHADSGEEAAQEQAHGRPRGPKSPLSGSPGLPPLGLPAALPKGHLGPYVLRAFAALAATEPQWWRADITPPPAKSCPLRSPLFPLPKAVALRALRPKRPRGLRSGRRACGKRTRAGPQVPRWPPLPRCAHDGSLDGLRGCAW